ncbi:hypothetical protein GGS23DRAFT_595626 [Durotheca rogersii]|uniref:uncharacterized protein n=1 Tax=Durotheca rogersii TaxID=419775 RepID=UPI002220BD97|nr:uncharacterized protein GGS23DRAFT_595626 [Durotheca rogersii]KAI5864935.1 hypothetical protein GGS23DRAFT_595626 [Durotheca rogersii]
MGVDMQFANLLFLASAVAGGVIPLFRGTRTAPLPSAAVIRDAPAVTPGSVLAPQNFAHIQEDRRKQHRRRPAAEAQPELRI